MSGPLAAPSVAAPEPQASMSSSVASMAAAVASGFSIGNKWLQSSIRMRPVICPISAKGTRVVLPAPGGATSTARPCAASDLAPGGVEGGVKTAVHKRLLQLGHRVAESGCRKLVDGAGGLGACWRVGQGHGGGHGVGPRIS